MDRRRTFKNETPETSDVVLCLYCGELLHAPEEDIFWEMTTGHNCEVMVTTSLMTARCIDEMWPIFLGNNMPAEFWCELSEFFVNLISSENPEEFLRKANDVFKENKD